MSVAFKAGCGALSRGHGHRHRTGRPSLELQPPTNTASLVPSPTGQQQRLHQKRAGWWPRNVNQHQAFPPHQPWRGRCQAVKAADGALQPGALQPGLLISYKKDDKHILALVEAPDGKKNWWIVDQRGRRFSLPARTVSLVLPGGNYQPADVQRFAEAAAAADLSLMEIAWAVAAEDVRSYSLQEMAKLLFDDAAALPQYITFSMLLHDSIYFKQVFKGGVWSFEPRDADAVQAAQVAAAAEAAAAAERAAFLEAWNAARAAATKERPSSTTAVQQAWKSSPHAERVASLMEFALSQPGKCAESAASLARDTLGLLRRRPEPDVAASLLVEAGLLRRHEPLPLLRLGRSIADFDPSLIAAAEVLRSAPPPDPDASTRMDLTHLTVYTVDDASTTEVDDGLSITTDEAGAPLLWVHVADPTRWLTPGDMLDAEARSRSRSLYFPWGAVPMFPRSLAEGPFSLGSSSSSEDGQQQQQQECCAFSVCASLNDDGSLGQLVSLGPSTIRVQHRLTYDEVDADLGLGPGMCQHEQLQALYEAARLRRAWRVSRGCIDIDLPEAQLKVEQAQLDALRPAVSCTKLSQWESAARLMVAEMMILAGEAVGSLGAAQQLPLPYRGQEAPQLPPQEALDALPEGPCKGYALRRCMTRSVIEPSPVRHASLALDAYVQFTSPIRRYSDILAHFNLKAHLRGEALPFSAAAISAITAAAGESARELGRAEGEVTKYWAAEYLRQHREQSWVGCVLGWFRPEMQLAAVTLEELGLESIVKVEFPVLPGDRLLLRLADVDVSSGYYRLYVEDRAAGPGGSSAAEGFSSDDLEAQEGEQEGSEGEGELEDELQDEVERALLSLEGELEQELQQRQGTAAAGLDEDSDALSVASEVVNGGDAAAAGVSRSSGSSLAWVAAAAVAQPDSPSSSSSSSRDGLVLTESPVGSYNSSEGSSELRARL
uniref:RNB domain-containing protein n=1 Tax=Tetradesmus obliquus TaxID=3088 RepID=A0A383WAQ3_TETOB|eukprot:jgi/Sobl393_1/15946/SZX78773.1